MSPLELPVHVRQMALGYCLPACAQMALAQLGIVVTQAQLAQVLGTRVGLGTPWPMGRFLHYEQSFSWRGAKWMSGPRF